MGIDLFSMEGLVIFLQIMLINIILSGDNAIVIAMASKNLPLEQRKKAIWWGAAGAVGLRVILTAIAVYILKFPYIQLFGSILLMYIAVKLLIEEEDHSNIKEAKTLYGAVWTIIVADFVMSLDNVLAIAAVARGDIFLIILGIALSIPLIIWGSTFILKLLTKFPILVYLGAGILGYTAGEMFVSEEKIQPYIYHVPHWLISVAAGILVILIGLLKKILDKERSKPEVKKENST